MLDDESHCNETLKRQLETLCPQIEIVSIFTSPLEFLDYASLHTFDLLFMDIKMPGNSGFQVLEKLIEYHFKVVFVTAFDQYAIQAFQYSAVDYLLKPVGDKELVDCVKRLSKTRNSPLHLEIVREMLHKLPDEKIRVAIPTMDAYEFVYLKDILRCQADRNYCSIYLQGHSRPLVCSKPLKEIEELLQDANFIRVHNSHLVNVHMVKRFLKSDGSLELLDGTVVPISRMRKEWVLDKLAIRYS